MSRPASPPATPAPARDQPLAADERSRWWREARFGAFFHWGLYAIPARSEWILAEEHIPVAEYERLLPHFHARRFNARAWARLAKAAGMKYAVFTTKHHDGFCLFHTRLTKFNSKRSPSGRDFTAEFVQACRDEGLGIGLYYSVPDWHHPSYPLPEGHPVRDLSLPGWRADEPRYFDYLLGQVRELLTGYGRIDLLWFDHPYGQLDGKRLIQEIRRLQPNILVNDRANIPPAERDWESPEQWIPRGPVLRDGRPVVWECAATMTGGYWGFDRWETNYRSPRQVVHMLIRCAAGGGNLLLNIGPCADGSISSRFTAPLRRVGQWLQRNGEAIYGTEAGPSVDWPHGRITRRGATLYLHLLHWPRDRRLPLPALQGRPRSARWLGGTELTVQGDALQLPARSPDPLAAVMRLDYDSESLLQPASVAKPPRPAPPEPEVVARQAPAVRLDGELNPESWQHAAVIRFSADTHYDYAADLDPQLAKGSPCSGELRLIHDGWALYAAVDVQSPLPLAREKNYLGDSVEWFFAAGDAQDALQLKGSARASHQRFHLVIGCDGSVLVESEGHVPGLVFRHAVKRTALGYRCVLALPLAMLWKQAGDPGSAIVPGDELRLNVVINQATPTAVDQRALAGRPRRGPHWWQRDPDPQLYNHKCRHRIYWMGRSLEDQMLPSTWARVKLERR